MSRRRVVAAALATLFAVLAVAFGVPLIVSWVRHAKSDGVVATAQILIVPTNYASQPPGDRAAKTADDYIATQIRVLKSETIAERANFSPELKNTPGFGDDKGTFLIIKSLSVEPEKVDSVLRLSAHGVSPDVGVAVLKAVIKAYQDFLNETYTRATDQILQGINEGRQDLEKKLTRAEKAYLDATIETNALGLDSEKMSEVNFTIAAKRLAKLGLQKVELAGRVEFLIAAGKDEKTKDALRIRAAEWAARLGLGKDDANPDRYISFLRLELGETEALEQAVQLKAKTAAQKFNEARVRTEKINTLKGDFDRAKEQFLTAIRRIEEMESLSRDHPGFSVAVISRAAAIPTSK